MVLCFVLNKTRILEFLRYFGTSLVHTYVRDRPYIPTTTSLCEGVNITFPMSIRIYCLFFFIYVFIILCIHQCVNILPQFVFYFLLFLCNFWTTKEIKLCIIKLLFSLGPNQQNSRTVFFKMLYLSCGL